MQKGFITLPDRPGLGVEMNEDAARKAQVPGNAVVRADSRGEDDYADRRHALSCCSCCAPGCRNASAQPGILTQELLIQYTPDWNGERFADGRPKVPDGISKRMKS